MSTKILFKNRANILATCFTLFTIMSIFKMNGLHQENFDETPNKLDIFDSNYKIVYLGNQQHTSYSTVVTTLFFFGKSKHSSSNYDAWSNTMIKSLGVPFVAFIDFYWEKSFLERAKQYNLTGKFICIISLASNIIFYSFSQLYYKFRNRIYNSIDMGYHE